MHPFDNQLPIDRKDQNGCPYYFNLSIIFSNQNDI